jgi:diacylglycerol kinase (ATP)
MKVFYIINPAGQGGKGTRAWEKFRKLWPARMDPAQVCVTERPGHARELATTIEGRDIIAAVGGDGTVGEVMSGIMDRQGTRPRLAIIPGGTGNDIALSMGITSIEDGVRSLREGRARAVDLIRVDGQVEGKPGHRHAFLFAAVGFSSYPMVRPWMKRLMGPRGAYYLGTLLKALIYQPPQMIIRTAGGECRGRIWAVVAGNAEKSAGGSMCLAPGARIDDGELNITIIPAGQKFKMITRLMPRIASGSHTTEPGISYFPGQRIEIVSEPPALLDLDGDFFGLTPATVTVCPRMLEIMVRPVQY